MSVIHFHDTLHGLRMGREIRNTSLESKLLQKLAAMREEVIYGIFLYLHKYYDITDCGRCLEILTA